MILTLKKNLLGEEDFVYLYLLLHSPVLIWGVSRGGWWFEEMSALFLGVALLLMFFSGLSEKDAVNTFIAGAGDFSWSCSNNRTSSFYQYSNG